MIDRRIEDKLRSLGLTGVYEGYFCLIHAIRLAEEDPQQLAMPTKWLYPDVAQRCGIAPSQVDSVLRSAIRRCCTACGSEVARMCGTDTPTVACFIRGLLDDLQGSER